MAYSSWTLDTVQETFELEEIDAQGLFADIEPVTPSAHLITALERKTALAIAISTEKAKSELIVADVLWNSGNTLNGASAFSLGLNSTLMRKTN